MRVPHPQATPAQSEPESWVDLYGDFLYRYALCRLRDAHAAEDVVQETFLAAIRSAEQPQGPEATRSWLVVILRTKIVDHFRRRARKPGSWGGEEDPTSLLFDSRGRWRPSALPALQPDEQLQVDDLRQVVADCLARLPEGQADVFVLSVMEERSSQEVCRALHIQPAAMWARLHRARLGLARCVAYKWHSEDK